MRDVNAVNEFPQAAGAASGSPADVPAGAPAVAAPPEPDRAGPARDGTDTPEALRHALEMTRQENRRLRGAAEQMRAEMLALNRSLAPWPQEEMEARLRRAKERIAALEQELAAVTGSSSWKLTGPYRRLGERLKHLRR
ncbi:hypothetical protein M0638_13865 [Roseomonas sp. NAR14]|uniref:Uncharacterized protein n=1 Tax=Roseomonas acroporae TaxID=2937791 RepID=A0A9X2BUG8_9PROT|nr:hypothetical protein [Roseomonas acroporae]MCK8785472.1 hypothetical protein [Roseomonas acroporae]